MCVCVALQADTVKLVSDTDHSKTFEVFIHQLVKADLAEVGGGDATLWVHITGSRCSLLALLSARAALCLSCRVHCTA